MSKETWFVFRHLKSYKMFKAESKIIAISLFFIRDRGAFYYKLVSEQPTKKKAKTWARWNKKARRLVFLQDLNKGIK